MSSAWGSGVGPGPAGGGRREELALGDVGYVGAHEPADGLAHALVARLAGAVEGALERGVDADADGVAGHGCCGHAVAKTWHKVPTP